MSSFPSFVRRFFFSFLLAVALDIFFFSLLTFGVCGVVVACNQRKLPFMIDYIYANHSRNILKCVCDVVGMVVLASSEIKSSFKLTKWSLFRQNHISLQRARNRKYRSFTTVSFAAHQLYGTKYQAHSNTAKIALSSSSTQSIPSLSFLLNTNHRTFSHPFAKWVARVCGGG